MFFYNNIMTLWITNQTDSYPGDSEDICREEHMKRILVIEDDTDQRELFATMLAEAGYEVLEAPNGEIGLRLFYKQPCELVITDIFMPEKEGLETILELKREFLTVKIIAISGGGLRGRHAGSSGADFALESAKVFGADRTLHKPIKIEQLLAAVDELLSDD
jgi:DNA-binding response OmpR family regulator